MPFDAMPELPAEARIIDAALEILGLKGKNWIQGQLGNKEIGYCMVGAILLARRRLKLKGDKTIRLIGKLLETDFMLPGEEHYPSQLAQGFNDQPRRSFGEVRAVMLKARRAVVKQ